MVYSQIHAAIENMTSLVDLELRENIVDSVGTTKNFVFSHLQLATCMGVIHMANC
jgi:hypothetical protein